MGWTKIEHFNVEIVGLLSLLFVLAHCDLLIDARFDRFHLIKHFFATLRNVAEHVSRIFRPVLLAPTIDRRTR